MRLDKQSERWTEDSFMGNVFIHNVTLYPFHSSKWFSNYKHTDELSFKTCKHSRAIDLDQSQGHFGSKRPERGF